MKTGTGLLLLFYFSLLILAGTGCRSVQSSHTPTVIEQLLEGNERFAGMHPIHPHESRQRVAEIAAAQHPLAAVICCSDSRVPPEIIFDQGLGDLFVVRTAGNLMSGLEIGSIEYAVEHLGIRHVIVMGHQQCGAIKAFIDGGETTGHIRDIVDSIRQEIEVQQVSPGDENRLEDCVRANILHGVKQLSAGSPMLAAKILNGELQVTGACYDLQKGIVEIIR